MAVSSTSPVDHTAHDALLLAALASGDVLEPADRSRADDLVRGCPDCALLLADMTAIREATTDLPAPPRRRDFRLTHGDAARLRPSGWRRVLSGFGSPRARLTGPAALGLATLGVAGLLVATIPSVPLAGSTSLDATGAGAAADTLTGPEGVSPEAPTALALPAPSEAATSPGAERAAEPQATDGKAAPEVAAPAEEPGAASPGVAALPAAGGTAAPLPARGGTAVPDEGAGGAAVTGSEPMTQAASANDAGAGAVVRPAAEASALTDGAGTGVPWLAAVSLLLLAAGLVLGGLRLAGKRAVTR